MRTKTAKINSTHHPVRYKTTTTYIFTDIKEKRNRIGAASDMGFYLNSAAETGSRLAI